MIPMSWDKIKEYIKHNWWLKAVVWLSIIIALSAILTYFRVISSVVYIIILVVAYMVFQVWYIDVKIEKLKDITIFQYIAEIIIIIFLILTLFAVIYIVPTDTNYLSYNNSRYDPTPLSAIYFSGVTFFSLGYGDIVPVGDTFRIVSIVEVFIGVFILVTFFSLGLSMIREKNKEKEWQVLRSAVSNQIKNKMNELTIVLLHLVNNEVVAVRTGTTAEDALREHKENLINQIRETNDFPIVAKNISEKSETAEIIEEFEIEIRDIYKTYGAHIKPEASANIIKLQDQLYTLRALYEFNLFHQHTFDEQVRVTLKEIFSDMESITKDTVLK